MNNFFNNFNNRNILIALISIIIFSVSALASYALFSRVAGPKISVTTPVTQGTDGQVTFDASLPKTEACPLNGQFYSKQQKDWWGKHRPLGVMIENHEETRPQSGLNSADIIYEAVAEGGITRLLSIFYCQDAGIVGPVRSARTYFLDFISEYGSSPLYVHVGGANQPGPADALSQIGSYGWSGSNDINQFSVGFPTFWRDYNRLGHATATEHTMYSTTDKLWQYAAKERDLKDEDSDGTHWSEGFIPYEFKEDANVTERGGSQTVHIEFWSSDSRYFVDWKYDNASNIYKRSTGGIAHLDKNTNKQLVAKNLVVLFMNERRANDGYENNLHLLYGTKGTGSARVYVDGKEVFATWRKDKRTARTLLFEKNGNPIKFNKGKIWFHIVPHYGEAQVQ